jgi:cytochrome P450
MASNHEAACAVSTELFTTPEGRRAPYPLYHRLRELEPVHKSPLGPWLVTRYDDVSAMLRDPRFGKDFAKQMETNVGPHWREHPSITRRERSMLNIEGPAHTRLRKRVIGAFKKRAIDGLRPSIEKSVGALVEPYAEAGGGDLMEAVAFPLPVTVIGEMLGVPAPDRPQFRPLVADLVAILEMRPSEAMLARADAAEDVIHAYFMDLIAEKRRRPADDVLSQLVHGDGDDPLDDAEICGMASLLFAAGFETTTNLIGNGLWGLLQHPDELARLRTDPERFEALPDELLRYDGTAQAAARYTSDEVEIGGVKIPAGESVLALLGAGNHDPEEFLRPDALDLGREKFRPLSFGGGIHFCLGASLAKAEIELTFRALVGRFDRIELAGEPPRFRDRLILRGLDRLELACRPGDGRAPRARVAAAPRPARPLPAPAGRREASDPSGARPAGRAGVDDARWRNALRAKVESDVAAHPPAWLATGPALLETVVLLARCEFFRTCTPEEIHELAATAYPITFEKGEPLTVQGAESLDGYVIEEGDVEVWVDGECVATLGENEVVGERGPLRGETRSATVIAASHVVTYAIARERLLALARASATASEGMDAVMRRRYGD